ncbi:RloB domain-containing protein [Vibrio vulnificus]|nr:RloB domain-containing protein [Vibrio vulnificus]
MPKKKPKKNIPVLPVFRMFCEGEKTEPLYIKGYIDHFHSEKRNVIVVEDSNKNTPVQLVDIAVDAKKCGHKDDVIWVVFDRESEAKYSHELHAKARKKADDNGIEIAFTNVCFEYWLLLHFVYTTASYSSCDDLLKNSPLKEELKKIGIESYDKGYASLFDKLKDKIPQAFENSKKLRKHVMRDADPAKTAPHHLNPYVDTDEMFLDIKNFIDKKGSVRQ